MTTIEADGTRALFELERLQARERAWGIAGGAIVEDGTTFTAYGLDGSQRWEVQSSADPMAAEVHGDRFVLGFAYSAGLSLAGLAPDATREVPSVATWIVSIDVASGEVADDVLVPLHAAGAEGTIVPLGDGFWGLFDHPDGAANHVLAREGEVVDRRAYLNSPPFRCPSGGCPGRPTYAVPSGAGAWVMFPSAPGSATYDGVTLSSGAFRAHLTYWDPSSAR